MLARLGNVLYWGGCVLAALVLLSGLLLFEGMSASDTAFYAALTLIASALVWLVGRAAKYVLAGN